MDKQLTAWQKQVDRDHKKGNHDFCPLAWGCKKTNVAIAHDINDEIQYIEITPVGLETPEGVADVNAALEFWRDAQARVCNAASSFIRDYYNTIATLAGDEDLAEDLNDLSLVVLENRVAQDKFLRAVAGNDRRKS